MDYFEQIAQLRNKMLHDRKWLVAAAIFVVLFSTTTLVAGIVVIHRAITDDRTSVRSVNTPTQVGLLLDDSPTDLINHIVFFNDVRLEAGGADDVFFVHSKDGESVLVLSSGIKSASALNADSVDVEGAVRAAPPVSILTRKWKLTKEQVKQVRKQGIYIEAESIRAKRTPTESLAKK